MSCQSHCFLLSCVRLVKYLYLQLKFSAKVFERCELARELVNKQGFARATVGNWVCLANVGLIKI